MSIVEIVFGIIILLVCLLIIITTLMIKQSRGGLSAAIGGGSSTMEARKSTSADKTLNKIIAALGVGGGICVFAISVVAAHWL